MAKSPRRRPLRPLITLAVLIVAVVGTILAGSRWSDATLTPKLALDLAGGTQLILTPVATDESEVTEEDVNQAIEIIRQRVDATGISEAEITHQGGQNIVVGLPGQPDPATLDLVRQSAVMRFRPVLISGGPGVIDPVALAEQDPEFTLPEPADGEEPPTREQIEAAATYLADSDGNGELSDEPLTEDILNNSDLAQISEQDSYNYWTFDCTDPENLRGGAQHPPGEVIVACQDGGGAKYLLGPTDVEGTHIENATSGLEMTQSGATTNRWVVSLQLDDEGTERFAEVSERLLALEPPRNQFAMVLDGLVLIAPTINEVIPDGQAQITGDFTQTEAATIANQLNFGSLPLNFEVQSEEQISATLGSEQLRNGLIAGLIGFALVALYLLWQYRGLAFVAIASLMLAAVVTYGVITLLSWTSGYRLSLAGVAGLIVAVGITADSFILYFERIRDEVRSGRSLTTAVEIGWARARRTIVVSDLVTLLAAVVLYWLAVGGVRGFAFTLGLTTLIDLLIVFLFTYPVMQLLIRTRFFGEGHKLSGLNPENLGASRTAYRSRPGTTRRAPAPAQSAESRRMTIAERREAERRAALEAGAVATAVRAEEDDAGEIEPRGDDPTDVDATPPAPEDPGRNAPRSRDGHDDAAGGGR